MCTYDTTDLDHSAGSLAQLAYSLNQLLPDDVCVMRAAHVDDAFDPRENRGKEYHYDFYTSATRQPLRRLHAWHAPPRHGAPTWDAGAAAGALELLVGEHSFSAFANRRRGAERHLEVDPRCTLHSARIERLGRAGSDSAEQPGECDPLAPDGYRLVLVGDRFLYKMARNIAGALVDVGYGRIGAEQIDAALRGGVFDGGRRPTAPAHGLVLHRVRFDCDPFG